MNLRSFVLAAALAAAVFFLPASDSLAGEPDSKDIITKSPYELGFLTGYGWCMDNHTQAPNIEDYVFMPSFSIPLMRKEVGRSFYRGIIQYQLEPVVGAITEPDGKAEVGLSFAGFKYNLTALQSRWSPYSNFGFGVIYEPIGHDVQGTNFNFIIQTGVGVEYFIDDKLAVNFQYRYRHISNAGIKMPNSGINSSFVLVGMSFF